MDLPCKLQSSSTGIRSMQSNIFSRGLLWPNTWNWHQERSGKIGPNNLDFTLKCGPETGGGEHRYEQESFTGLMFTSYRHHFLLALQLSLSFWHLIKHTLQTFPARSRHGPFISALVISTQKLATHLPNGLGLLLLICRLFSLTITRRSEAHFVIASSINVAESSSPLLSARASMGSTLLTPVETCDSASPESLPI